jgi:nucleotide-binding universal stress UspA family protein
MKTIVAPTDFSKDSVNAVNYAADMACITGTDLLLVHVCPYPVAVNEVQVAFYNMDEMMAEAQRQLDQLKDKMIMRTGERIRVSTMVKQGDIIEGIKECCLGANTYAVVMGRSEMGKFERFLLGTRTVSAMKHLSWPLIAVPPMARFEGIRNIGIACDFREVIETLPVEEIKSIVKEMKANLHVLHVSAETGDSFSSRTIEESGWFQDLLGDLQPRYHFIKGNVAEADIIDFADKHHLDLLIIIPKKHDLVGRIFGHSHSRQLVLHAHVPVMAIHE